MKQIFEFQRGSLKVEICDVRDEHRHTNEAYTLCIDGKQWESCIEEDRESAIAGWKRLYCSEPYHKSR